MYKARRITKDHVTGYVEFEASDDQAAAIEAEDGVDTMKGEWVEILPIHPKREVAESEG